MKKKMLIGLDTETTNTITLPNGKIDTSNPFAYDIGWLNTDTQGKIYRERKYAIEEIYRWKEMMLQATFADKIPLYDAEIASGERKLVSIWEAKDMMEKDCAEFDVEAIFAHNASFDVRALNSTLRYITSSRKRYFLPRHVDIWDTMRMSKVITSQKNYAKFCEQYGYMTKHKKPRPQRTAEVIYRYITKNPEFVESHTGLEDARIETEILAYCFRQHKKMNKVLYKGFKP